ncbi:ATP-binding protein [Laspinema olomoucense]|uniref:ATP-binding protein n=1 Tax=Laspinema olomoucense TaxID=3231600 RepID=UPI0021BB7C98|nr:ATP-binding protein [Laspinema sp. D3d]MCT7971679.1 ATP-binding protein [Laspinema sp. D3d]
MNQRVNPLGSEKHKYYVDLSKIIGNEVNKIHSKITSYSPNEPTCTVLTGYIGSGKSTELLRLKNDLEVEGFHVVYFVADEELNMIDVSIPDIWLAIACRIVQSLDAIEIKEPAKLNKFLQEYLQILDIEYPAKIKENISKATSAKIGKGKDIFTWSLGISEVLKTSIKKPLDHKKLTQFLDAQKTQLIEVINQEVIEPIITQVKARGKHGLVVIIDGVDRIDNLRKPWGQRQHEYLFISQGKYLTKLNCHLVFTLPIYLLFSNHYEILTQHFGELRVLRMVPVRSRDGSEHQEGMALLRQMVLIKAFPDLDEQQRLEAIPLVFENAEALDRLCHLSGGHIRNLNGLLMSWVMEEDYFPLKREALEKVIFSYREDLRAAILDEDWELLRQVKTSKPMKNEDPRYQMLIRAMFVFEYREGDEVWVDINPALSEAEELQT